MFERIGVVPFRGTIRERTVEPYVRLLRALRDRPAVRGVLIDISSGGGESTASMDLHLAIRRLDAITPVFVSIGAAAASGAYLAAVGARRIFAYPESAVGSIGVVMPHLAVRDLLAKLGISVELLHEGRHKDAYQGVRPLTEEERGKLQGILREDYDRFVAVVAEARHRPVEQIRELATGEFWSGQTALKLGLVDAMGDREMALAALADEVKVPVGRAVTFSPPRPWLERVLGTSSAIGGDRNLLARLREAAEDAILAEWIGLR
ncbi:MAG: signal peptide peptidase SppA [Thermoplasmata archaeon]